MVTEAGPGMGWVNAAFLFVTVIGYYIALTFYCTPYNALIAELGHDSKQQLAISTAISFTWMAGTAVAYVAPVVWGGFVAAFVVFTCAFAFAGAQGSRGIGGVTRTVRETHVDWTDGAGPMAPRTAPTCRRLVVP